MPWQVAGFARNYSWIADANAGLLIDATRMDTDTNDIASGLTQVRSMAQSGSLVWGGTATGSANAITIALSPAPTSYTAGLRVSFLPGATNTGPATLQLGSLTAVAMRNGGAALLGGEIQAGVMAQAEYDGTYFQLLGAGAITAIAVGPNLSVSSPANRGTVTISLNVPVAVAAGGTGATSLTQYGVLTGGGTGPVTAVAPGVANTVLTSTGAGSAPSYQAISGILDTILGGTQGSLAMRGATSWQALPPGPGGSFLTSGGSGANLLWSSNAVTTLSAGAGINVSATTGAVTVSLLTPVAVSNGGTGASSAAAALTSLGAAPIASPTFTGIPTGPTASYNTNTTQLATCAFVLSQITNSISGVASITAGAGLSGGGTGAVTLSVAPSGVVNNMLAAMPANTAKANLTGSSAGPTDVTMAQLATALGIIPVIISDTAPPLIAGDMWFDSIGLQMYIAYNDGTSTQWVLTNNLGSVSAPVPVSQGGTGASSFTANALLKGAGTGPLSVSSVIDSGTSVTIGEPVVIGTPAGGAGAGGSLTQSGALVINANAAALPADQPANTMLRAATSDNNTPVVLIDGYGSNIAGRFQMRAANGTAAARTAIPTGTGMGIIEVDGWNGSAYVTGSLINTVTTQPWNATNCGASINIATTSLNSTALSNRMFIAQGVVIGNASGDPGQGGLVLNSNAATGPTSTEQLKVTAADGTGTQAVIRSFGATGGLRIAQSQGTAAAPTATPSGYGLGFVTFAGWNGSAFADSAYIYATATENYTATTRGSRLDFWTTPIGANAAVDNMTLDGLGRLTAAHSLVLGSSALPPTAAASTILFPSSGIALLTSYQNCNIGANLYYDGSWRYLTAAPGALSNVATAGSYFWYTSPTGAAGAVAALNSTMYLDAGGNLQIYGGTATKPGGGSWVAPSDRSLKSSTEKWSTGLAEILKLEPLAYLYRNKDWNHSEQPYIGLDAQDAAAVIPEMERSIEIQTGGRMVDPGEPPETFEAAALDHTPVIFALVNAVKSLHAEIAELKKNR